MKNDGKSLEALVSLIERLHVPPGVEVKTNTKVFNDEGVQVAEFDVEIRGDLGTTKISWLIQCRDRQGTAPADWIEQLVGRRGRFGFNKVTAVSTSGFSPGAISYANKEGIELREVKSLSAEEFSRWLVAGSMPLRRPQAKLLQVNLIFSPEDLPHAETFIKGISQDEKIFRSIDTGWMCSAFEIFQMELRSQQVDAFMQTVRPEDGVKKGRFTAQYPNDASHYVVKAGEVKLRVRELIFVCEFFVSEEIVPIFKSAQYGAIDDGKPISQMVAYNFSALGKDLALEMHNISRTGETHVVLRVLGDSDKK